MVRQRSADACVRLICKNDRHVFAIDRPFWMLPQLLQMAFAKLPRGSETPIQRSFYELMAAIDVEGRQEDIVQALRGNAHRLDEMFASCAEAVIMASVQEPGFLDVLNVIEDRLRMSLEQLPKLAAAFAGWEDGVQPVPCMCVDVSDLL